MSKPAWGAEALSPSQPSPQGPQAVASVAPPGAEPAQAGELRWRAMTQADIAAVLAFEQAACLHPLHAWSDDNYRSSLRSGYWSRVGCDAQGQVVAVCVAMFGVDELHLLNIAVHKAWHGRGLAREMLAQLVGLCRAHALTAIWLEVRPSNAPARALYQACGYVDVGVRKQYYPAPEGREDALVMKREVARASLE